MVTKLIEDGKLDDTPESLNGNITSQREITTKKLFKEWKLTEKDKEFTLLIITGKTMEDEEISCIVYDEWRDGWSSMSRTTGLTACAITNLIIDKNLNQTGIITLEELGTNQDYFDYITNYLDKKEININFSNGKNSLEKE
jgi:saccharopine dehydrogenase-like NADP-dependent oxidoreductase